MQTGAKAIVAILARCITALYLLGAHQLCRAICSQSIFAFLLHLIVNYFDVNDFCIYIYVCLEIYMYINIHLNMMIEL